MEWKIRVLIPRLVIYMFWKTQIQRTTRITVTGITNLTGIANEMAASSHYLMKYYFNGFLAVSLE